MQPRSGKVAGPKPNRKFVVQLKFTIKECANINNQTGMFILDAFDEQDAQARAEQQAVKEAGGEIALISCRVKDVTPAVQSSKLVL